MDIATQIAVIRAGLWNPNADLFQGEAVLPDSAKLRMVNWIGIRTALEILDSKAWANTTNEWRDVEPYLAAAPAELILEGNNEVQGFRNRIQNLKTALETPMSVLESEHPLPPNWQNEPASYIITATELPAIQAELKHLQEVLDLLGFESAFSLSRIAIGSMDFVLWATGLARLGLQAAIAFFHFLKASETEIEELERGIRSSVPREKMTDEECRVAANATVRAQFLGNSILIAEFSAEVEKANKAGEKVFLPEAETRINKAVDKMMDNDGLTGQWLLRHHDKDSATMLLGGDLSKLTPAQILALNPAPQKGNQEAEDA